MPDPATTKYLDEAARRHDHEVRPHPERQIAGHKVDNLGTYPRMRPELLGLAKLPDAYLLAAILAELYEIRMLLRNQGRFRADYVRGWLPGMEAQEERSQRAEAGRAHRNGATGQH